MSASAGSSSAPAATGAASSGVRFDGTPSAATLQAIRQAEQAFSAPGAASDRIGSEILALTYGALVVQLLKDYKDINIVNGELEKMGFNIGIRAVDDFLAKSGVASCTSFKDTVHILAKAAFRMFLGITADGTNCTTQ
jgi:hypothetical protein